MPKHLVADDGSLGERNDVVLVGLNHKMGYRGTTNTLLNFGEGAFTPGGQAGAVGHLVGEEGQGLNAMFHMMNEARVSVGAGAMALGYTGYLHALQYAEERTQGRPLADKDPSSPPVRARRPPRRAPDAAGPEVLRRGGAGARALLRPARRRGRHRRVRRGPRDADVLLGMLTPIAKSWPSQWCLAANDLAIQVHGGYGYTRDYAVEQFYRDNRLNPIHEGTHGIQALDLLGRKVVLDGGRGLGAARRPDARDDGPCGRRRR